MRSLKVEHISTWPNWRDVFIGFCRLQHFSRPPPLLAHSAHISFIWSNSVQDFDLRRSWKYSFPQRQESKERGWTNTVYTWFTHFCRKINLFAITGGTLDKIWWEGAQKHFIGLGIWGLPRPPNNCPLIDYAKIQFFFGSASVYFWPIFVHLRTLLDILTKSAVVLLMVLTCNYWHLEKLYIKKEIVPQLCIVFWCLRKLLLWHNIDASASFSLETNPYYSLLREAFLTKVCDFFEKFK